MAIKIESEKTLGGHGSAAEIELYSGVAKVPEQEENPLEFEGEEGEFGMSIMTVNGETADFNVDASYWSFYVNDEYCNYGVSEQPVEDRDAFAIVYTVYEE